MTDLSAEFKALAAYRPTHKVRFVTAASLFDGHDAAINIMRRILQGMGVEVIHLGHNRSVDEVVTAALQEDVQGIAVSSYQGGHVEFFKYMLDLLRERGGYQQVKLLLSLTAQHVTDVPAALLVTPGSVVVLELGQRLLVGAQAHFAGDRRRASPHTGATSSGLDQSTGDSAGQRIARPGQVEASRC
jgi:methylmalonyl-CoA mutase cobalamin-binding domain/chain